MNYVRTLVDRGDFDASEQRLFERVSSRLVAGEYDAPQPSLVRAAGVACAIEATAQGADVVLLEKFCRPDGNTLYASGRICCVGSRYQKDVDDSVDAFVKDQIHETRGVGDPECMRAFAELSGETMDWIIDMGVPLSLT